MSSLSFPSPQSAKGVHAARHRKYGPNSPEVRESATLLAEAKIAAYISRVVADAPPLTSAQRARLAGLLMSGGVAE